MTTKQIGKITSKQMGLLQVWSCSCETPCVEIDETSVICLEELGGCGAYHHKGYEE